MNWADKLLEVLQKHWINTVFGYPGWANMPLYDKLECCPEIKHILVRNEQGASFAAQGWARTKKEIWVCFGTSGPWASNLITWVMDAMMDSIPMLVVTGQVPLAVMWTDAFQELDTIWTFMSITKHSFVVDDVNKIEAIVDEAIKMATSWRPWPVLIDFPKDISIEEITEKKQLEKPLFYSNVARLEISDEQIEKTLEMLKNSKKPVLLIWQWVKFANAEKELNEFVEKLWVPTVSTLLAKWTLREDNPNYLWMIGMHGTYAGNMATYNADLIINIGSRFDDRLVGTYESFVENWKKIIHIDIDIAELSKVLKTDLAIHSDGKVFLKKILWEKNLKKLEIEDWKKQVEKFKNKKACEFKTEHFSTKNALNIVNNFTEKNLDKYIFTTDVGQHQMWSAQILKVPSTTAWLTSGGAGTMWFSIPVSTWASVANPEKTIINIVWDWSVQMNIQELQVLKDHNLNVKVIIMNNNFLWMVRQWQDLFFDKNYASTPMTSPDFAKVAEAYWINWYTVKSEKELEKVLEKELEINWPAVIEVQVEWDEDNIFPMVPTGYSLENTIVCREEL